MSHGQNERNVTLELDKEESFMPMKINLLMKVDDRVSECQADPGYTWSFHAKHSAQPSFSCLLFGSSRLAMPQWRRGCPSER